MLKKGRNKYMGSGCEKDEKDIFDPTIMKIYEGVTVIYNCYTCGESEPEINVYGKNLFAASKVFDDHHGDDVLDYLDKVHLRLKDDDCKDIKRLIILLQFGTNLSMDIGIYHSKRYCNINPKHLFKEDGDLSRYIIICTENDKGFKLDNIPYLNEKDYREDHDIVFITEGVDEVE